MKRINDYGTPNLRPSVRTWRKPCHGNFIRDKMQETSGWTTQRGINSGEINGTKGRFILYLKLGTFALFKPCEKLQQNAEFLKKELAIGKVVLWGIINDSK